MQVPAASLTIHGWRVVAHCDRGHRGDQRKDTEGIPMDRHGRARPPAPSAPAPACEECKGSQGSQKGSGAEGGDEA